MAGSIGSAIGGLGSSIFSGGGGGSDYSAGDLSFSRAEGARAQSEFNDFFRAQ